LRETVPLMYANKYYLRAAARFTGTWRGGKPKRMYKGWGYGLAFVFFHI